MVGPTFQALVLNIASFVMQFLNRIVLKRYLK